MPDWLAVVLVVVAVSSLVLVMLVWTETRGWGMSPWRRRSILRNGTAARATIVDEITRSIASRGKIVVFLKEYILDVRPPGGAPFRATSKASLRMSQSLGINKGTEVPVRIAADGIVVIDLDAIEADRGAEAAAKRAAFDAQAKTIRDRQG